MHVNLDQLAQGKIGEWMEEMSLMILFATGEDSPLSYFTDEANNISGGVTVYGTGKKPENSVIRATGLNNMEALIEKIEESKDHDTIKNGQYTIHSWKEVSKHPRHKNKEVQVYAVMLDDSTMMACQSVETLNGALDFIDSAEPGIRPPADPGAAMIGKANLEGISKKAHSDVFRKAKSMESAMNVAADGSISGRIQIEATDKDGAERMYQMIDGMITFGSAYARDGHWNPAQNVKTSQSGNMIQIDLTVPISQLEKLKNMKHHRRKSPEA